MLIQKKIRNKVIISILCSFLALSVSAEDMDFGKFRIESRKGGCIVFSKTGERILSIAAQLHMPEGPEGKKFTWKNFRWLKRTSVEEKGENRIIKGTCEYQEDLHEVKASILMDYEIEISHQGKLVLSYNFTNNGQDVYVEPYVKINLNYDLLKGQKWSVKKVQGEQKNGVWEDKTVHGIKSISWRKNKDKTIDTQVISGTLETSLGKSLVLALSPETHLRFHGGGEITLYNYDHFAGVHTAYDWKRMKKAESFSIKTVITLPVDTETAEKNSQQLEKKSLEEDVPESKKVDCFAYEERNKPARPEIKNGTFYLHGKPVFMVGACKKLILNTDKFPVEGYQQDPAYNRVINYEIAQNLGFNSLHPRIIPWPVGKKLNPDSPALSRKAVQWETEKFPGFIKELESLPLVAGYSLKCKLADFVSNDLKQKISGWHNYVPFCPEDPIGKGIYRDFWIYGARVMLENGGNPWIYELFNEPVYDCRCEYNKERFIRYVKNKYGTLKAVNEKWGTDFQTLDKIVADTNFEKEKGLWVDWLKFIEDRWCSILKDGMETIREIDGREKVYFSSQRCTRASFLRTNNGYDEYKNARVLDVITTEGGINFYRGKENKTDDPFEAHLQGKMQMQLDIARAAAEGKPVIDNEQSTRRFDETGKRIPSRRQDLNLMLWNETIHGASAVQIYHWHHRALWWPSPDLKGACEFVNNPKNRWAMACLANPYNYSRESLKGIKDFNREIAKLAEIVLPMPRIKGKVALLLSNPSRRYTRDVSTPFIEYYDVLESTHYPMDVIFEEQINKGWADKYRVVISPYCRYVYKDTADNLKEYVRNGGVIILQGMDLSFDEYGACLDNNEFLGIKSRVFMSAPVPDELIMKIPVAEGYPEHPESRLWIRVIPDKDSRILAESKRGIPQIISRGMGKGKVYYMAGKTKGMNLSSVLVSVLKDAGIYKPFRLRKNDGSLLPGVEAQLLDRGKNKLYYLVNWNRTSELGILNLDNLKKGKYCLTDPVSDNVYLSPDGKHYWDKKDLEEGFKIFLPGEEKILLLVTEDLPKEVNELISQEKVTEVYQMQRKKDEIGEKIIKQRQIKEYREYQQRNSYMDVESKNCFYIDISGQCNMGFKDNVAFDKKGGGFDHGGRNDLGNFPSGEQIFSNVPFFVIDPSENNGKSIIVIKGEKQNYFPEKVENIPVNRKTKHIYFLHTAAWKNGEFAYVIHYKNGQKKEVLIRFGKEIGGWWHIAEDTATEAKIAWKGHNKSCNNIGVYCYRWENPQEEEEIESIEIKSYNAEMVPAIIAITGETL
jgi:beta-galactosidase GanA